MRLLLAVLLAAASVSCSSAPVQVPTEPDARLLVDPIVVETVDVLILESFPAQATAHVRGWIGDGCSTLHSTDIRREGDTVTITILRQRPAEAICTQQARLYDEQLALPGDYPPGEYVVRVNGVERRFRT